MYVVIYKCRRATQKTIQYITREMIVPPPPKKNGNLRKEKKITFHVVQQDVPHFIQVASTTVQIFITLKCICQQTFKIVHIVEDVITKYWYKKLTNSIEQNPSQEPDSASLVSSKAIQTDEGKVKEKH